MTQPEWVKWREQILHRDGACQNCGVGIGLGVHHIHSRGSGGRDEEPNLITLCISCHHAAHDGFIVPGGRMLRSKAQKKRVPFYEGKRMRHYFEGLLEKKHGYDYG